MDKEERPAIGLIACKTCATGCVSKQSRALLLCIAGGHLHNAGLKMHNIVYTASRCRLVVHVWCLPPVLFYNCGWHLSHILRYKSHEPELKYALQLLTVSNAAVSWQNPGNVCKFEACALCG